jgi:hypothetical protein
MTAAGKTVFTVLGVVAEPRRPPSGNVSRDLSIRWLFTNEQTGNPAASSVSLEGWGFIQKSVIPPSKGL